MTYLKCDKTNNLSNTSQYENPIIEVIDIKESKNKQFILQWEIIFLKDRKGWLGNLLFHYSKKNKEDIWQKSASFLYDNESITFLKQNVNLCVNIKTKNIAVKVTLICVCLDKVKTEMIIRINHGLKMHNIHLQDKKCEFQMLDACNNGIKIKFPKKIYFNEIYKLELIYSGIPILRRPSYWEKGRLILSEESMILPCLNLFPRNWYQIELNLKTKFRTNILGCGEKIENGKWISKEKTSGLCLIAGNYNIAEYSFKICHTYFYYTQEFKMRLEEAKKEIEKSILYFTTLFGIFPYDVINIVCDKDAPICFINSNTIVLNHIDIIALSHEMVHIWWGGCIKGNGPDWKLFHEGFAELFSDIYIFQKNKSGTIEDIAERYIKLKKTDVNVEYNKITISCEVTQQEINSYKIYVMKIMEKVGVKTFLKRCRYIVQKYCFGNIDVDNVWHILKNGKELKSSFEDATGIYNYNPKEN